MHTLSPRRRRAVALSALTTCFAGGLLPLQQHLLHGRHPVVVIAVYLGVVFTQLTLALREMVKLRREEGCGTA